MLFTPLGLRLDPSRPIREQIRTAAQLGARGVVVDAIGDLAPNQLSETGRRELPRPALEAIRVWLACVGKDLATMHATASQWPKVRHGSGITSGDITSKMPR